jgi:hypothetical protein
VFLVVLFVTERMTTFSIRDVLRRFDDSHVRRVGDNNRRKKELIIICQAGNASLELGESGTVWCSSLSSNETAIQRLSAHPS